MKFYYRDSHLQHISLIISYYLPYLYLYVALREKNSDYNLRKK